MSTSHSVWVSRPLFPEVLAHLAKYVDVHAETVERTYSAAELREKLTNVDGAIVSLSDRIDGGVVTGNQRLRVVSNLAVGYNNFDVPALTAAGILATNTPDVLNETTADFA